MRSHYPELDRRTFLKLAAAAGVVAVGGGPVATTLLGPRIASGQSGTANVSQVELLAEALEYDTDRIFRFVADEVRYEPYVGVLRGAAGTLAAMAGNSADQAQLLAGLLAASQIRYRFAQGVIDAGSVSAIMDGAAQDGRAIREAVLGAMAGASELRGPSSTAAPGADVLKAVEAATVAGPQAVGWARDKVEQTVDAIAGHLRDGGISVPDSFAEMPDMERAQHTWLQIAYGTGWMDLDPTSPGAASGEAPTDPAVILESLPDEQHHRVRVSVVAERVRGAALAEETLLEVEFQAGDLTAKPLLFANIRPEGFKGTGIGIGDLLLGTMSYVPMLTYGDSAMVGDRFWFGTGPELLEDAPDGLVEGDTTAEWLEVSVTSPGRPPRTVRREVFDRIAAGARASGFDLAAVQPIELSEFPISGPAEYLPALTTHWLTISTGTLGGEALQAALRLTEEPESFAAVAQAYHLVREATGVEVALGMGVHAVVDAPNVVGMSSRAVSDGASMGMQTGIDIWHRSYTELPVRDALARAAPAIVAGVTSHIAERVLVGDAAPTAATRTSLPVSVGAIFDEAMAQGIPTRLLRGAGEESDLEYPADARAHLSRALQDGWLAIAPERSVLLAGRERAGWWLVDPRTGRTIDQLDDGRGGALADEAMLIQNIIKTHPAWLILRTCIVGAALVAASLLGVIIAGSGDSAAALGAFAGAAAAAAFPAAAYCAAAG